MRQKITLTKPVAPTKPEKHRAGEIACDEVLFENLRTLRKHLADERAVPPYIIFSDVALRQMARFYPASDQAFSHISGVGDKKLREFGEFFLHEIVSHLQSNPRQIFADDSFSNRAESSAQSGPSAEAGFDEALFARLRRLRKQLADERSVSAFIVLYDSALREIARQYPATEAEFAGIRHVGVKKTQDFGGFFLAEIAEHLRTSSRQTF